jgi:transposase
VEHIAIDLGGRESQICVRNDQGEILEERRHLTARLARYLAKRAPGGRVLLETRGVCDCGRSTRVRTRGPCGAIVAGTCAGRRRSTAEERSTGRSQVSEMDCRMDVPSVHIPSAQRRDQQARVTARLGLVEARTKLVNIVGSFFRTSGQAQVKATSKTLVKNVRKRLAQQPEGLPDYIEHILCLLNSLNEQIALADAALQELANTDVICKRLQTMPGVGPMTSVSFATAIDEVDRFESASKLTSYLGLTPGEKTTGFKTKRTGITKAG